MVLDIIPSYKGDGMVDGILFSVYICLLLLILWCIPFWSGIFSLHGRPKYG